MKLVFMGTPDFAVGTLQALIESEHEILAVVTQPDKAKGRSGKLTYSPVKECALEAGIKVLQPEKARDEDFIKELEALGAEVIVVVAYGQILPESIINMPKYGCINVHASLLPKYRGAAPIQWAVINGDKVSGVTTMKMDVGLDTGDILEVAELELDKKETGGSLFDKLAGVGAKLLIKTLADLKDGKIEPKKQDEASASYVHMLKKSLGQIDFKNSAEEIERLIRGLNPWPSAYTSLDSKMLKIWDADLADQEELKLLGLSDSSDFEPGKIVAVSKNNIYVACGSGVLRLNEPQAEGKKRMSCADFLKGHKIEAGRLI